VTRHTSPQALPTGVRPGPVTLPATPVQTPEPWHSTRTDLAAAARQLTQHLRASGHTRIYASTAPGRAVVSLPTLTIWITPTGLSWTRNGEATTWPAHDPGGAARHITQMTQPAPQPPAP
jgi:hypothetical protein